MNQWKIFKSTLIKIIFLLKRYLLFSWKYTWGGFWYWNNKISFYCVLTFRNWKIVTIRGVDKNIRNKVLKGKFRVILFISTSFAHSGFSIDFHHRSLIWKNISLDFLTLKLFYCKELQKVGVVKLKKKIFIYFYLSSLNKRLLLELN